MECQRCSLNIDSACFRPALFKKLPLHVRDIFICNGPRNTASPKQQQLLARNVCVRDLWVLTFIGENNRYACEKASETLDNLVAGGHAELLCNLFENAQYETRRDLWLRMTSLYPERLYLFDSLFEKECLAPVESGQIPDDLHIYQHQMLFAANSTNPPPHD